MPRATTATAETKFEKLRENPIVDLSKHTLLQSLRLVYGSWDLPKISLMVRSDWECGPPQIFNRFMRTDEREIFSSSSNPPGLDGISVGLTTRKALSRTGPALVM